MLAATSPQYEWIPEIDRVLLTNGRYRMAVLVPSSWTMAQTQTYLEARGWNVVSIGAPPPDVAAVLAKVTTAGITTAPAGWWVIATWTGADRTVLPTNDGQLYYVTLDFYSQVTPTQPSGGASPTASASSAPTVLAFLGGAAVIGTLAYLSNRGAFRRGHAMANPLSMTKYELDDLDTHALVGRIVDLEHREDALKTRIRSEKDPLKIELLSARLEDTIDDFAAARSVYRMRLQKERVRLRKEGSR